MVEIKPGPELDRAVADVVGDPYPRAHDWEYTGLGGYETCFFRCKRCGRVEADYSNPGYNPKDPCLIHYSTDLNATFAAAEKVGLFTDGSVYLTQDIHGEWYVGQWATGKFLGRSMTFPTVICAAILKLKEKTE